MRTAFTLAGTVLFALLAAVAATVGGAYLCWWLIPGWVGLGVATLTGGVAGILVLLASWKAWEISYGC